MIDVVKISQILKKISWIIIGTLLSLLLALTALWFALPALFAHWNPLGLQCQCQGRLSLSQRKLVIPPLQLMYQGKRLLIMPTAARLSHQAVEGHKQRWQLIIPQLIIYSQPWKTLLAPTRTSTPLAEAPAPPQWLILLRKLLHGQLVVEQCYWETDTTTPLSLQLSHRETGLYADIRHPLFQGEVSLIAQRRLQIRAHWQTNHPQYPAGQLQSKCQFDKYWRAWPSHGQLQIALQPTQQLPNVYQLLLQWQEQQGKLQISTKQDKELLLDLPWQWKNKQLQCQSGDWFWPYGPKPLSGSLQLQWINQRQANKPGYYGQLRSHWQLNESPWGKAMLQLNAQLAAVELKKILIHWDYQLSGDGKIPLPSWQSQGQGSYCPLQQQLVLKRLTANIDSWKWGLLQEEPLRLSLQKPMTVCFPIPQNQPPSTSYWQLTTRQLQLPHQRSLRQLVINGEIQASTTLQQLTWRGVLQAAGLKPLQGQGTWKNQQFLGELWWKQQPLAALQSLLPAKLPWQLKQGLLTTRATINASAVDRVNLQGHLRLQRGAVSLPEGTIKGITLDIPFSWQQQWRLGQGQRPARLLIDELQQQVTLRQVALNARGSLPYQSTSPLQFCGEISEVLGGKITLPWLQLPQQRPGLLTLTAIDLAQLTGLLGQRQWQLTGKISGKLPFYIEDPRWLIHQGYLWNSTPLNSVLDPILANNLRPQVGEQVADWLTHLIIHQAQIQLQLDTLGKLTLDSTLHAVTAQQPSQPIHLRYRHQENLLTLWRSLKASRSLQQQIEQQTSSISRKP